MKTLQDILSRIGVFFRRTYARLLAKMYASCRETCCHVDGKNKRMIEFRCQAVEDLCYSAGVYIPENHSISCGSHIKLLRWYMARRFSWDLRITIYKGKTLLNYLEIPLKKIDRGIATNLNQGLCIWDNLVKSQTVRPNTEHLTKKPFAAIHAKEDSDSTQAQPMVLPKHQSSERLINTKQEETLNEEPNAHDNNNTVEVNGIIIDNSF